MPADWHVGPQSRKDFESQSRAVRRIGETRYRLSPNIVRKSTRVNITAIRQLFFFALLPHARKWNTFVITHCAASYAKESRDIGGISFRKWRQRGASHVIPWRIHLVLLSMFIHTAMHRLLHGRRPLPRVCDITLRCAFRSTCGPMRICARRPYNLTAHICDVPPAEGTGNRWTSPTPRDDNVLALLIPVTVDRSRDLRSGVA